MLHFRACPTGLERSLELIIAVIVSDFTFTFHFHVLEKEMATHSSVLAWRIPGMGEPGGLPFMGLHRVGHDWCDLAAAAAAVCAHRSHPSRLLSKPFPSRCSSWWSQPDLNSPTCEFPQLFSHKPFTSLNLLVFPLSKLSSLQDYDPLNVGTMFLLISSLVFYFLSLYTCFVWLIWTEQPNCHLTVLVIFNLAHWRFSSVQFSRSCS